MSSVIKNNKSTITWSSRYKRNCYIYILIYAFLGVVAAIANDVLISYLDIIVPNVVKGINIYSAISSILVALILILVHRFGYKKILLFIPFVTILSLIFIAFIDNTFIITFSYIVLVAGITLYDFMYPLMYTSYVPKQKRTFMMSIVMVVNLITQAIMTFFDGKLVVFLLGKFKNISYKSASLLTSNTINMSKSTMHSYILAYRWVIMMAAIFMVMAYIATLFLKEKRADYADTPIEELDFNFKPLFTKYVVWWIIFLGLIQIGALLVVPYFPIYLNKFLHIQRGTVSTIIALQTVAMAISYLFAPWLEKKMGSVSSNAVITLLCIPLMLLLANGTIFGSSIVIAIGIIFFLRSGFANATMPIQQSFQMMLVKKDLRPAFSSLTLITNAIIGIIVGLFTRYILLKNDSGYAIAYYLTSLFYLFASIVLLWAFHKKYNRIMEEQTNTK